MVLERKLPECGNSTTIHEFEEEHQQVAPATITGTSAVSVDDYMQYVVDLLAENHASEIEDISLRGEGELTVTFFHDVDTTDVLQLFRDLEMYHVRSGVAHMWDDKLPTPTVTYSIFENSG